MNVQGGDVSSNVTDPASSSTSTALTVASELRRAARAHASQTVSADVRPATRELAAQPSRPGRTDHVKRVCWASSVAEGGARGASVARWAPGHTNEWVHAGQVQADMGAGRTWGCACNGTSSSECWTQQGVLDSAWSAELTSKSELTRGCCTYQGA
eukprot:325071-Chlamydomonas_euryale.AAC.2